MKFRSELEHCKQFVSSTVKLRWHQPNGLRGAVSVPCPGQTKVTDLEVTGGVEKQIAGLQISVENICGVYELEPSQNLCHVQIAVQPLV